MPLSGYIALNTPEGRQALSDRFREAADAVGMKLENADDTDPGVVLSQLLQRWKPDAENPIWKVALGAFHNQHSCNVCYHDLSAITARNYNGRIRAVTVRPSDGHIKGTGTHANFVNGTMVESAVQWLVRSIRTQERERERRRASRREEPRIYAAPKLKPSVPTAEELLAIIRAELPDDVKKIEENLISEADADNPGETADPSDILNNPGRLLKVIAKSKNMYPQTELAPAAEGKDPVANHDAWTHYRNIRENRYQPNSAQFVRDLCDAIRSFTPSPWLLPTEAANKLALLLGEEGNAQPDAGPIISAFMERHKLQVADIIHYYHHASKATSVERYDRVMQKRFTELLRGQEQWFSLAEMRETTVDCLAEALLMARDRPITPAQLAIMAGEESAAAPESRPRELYPSKRTLDMQAFDTETAAITFRSVKLDDTDKIGVVINLRGKGDASEAASDIFPTYFFNVPGDSSDEMLREIKNFLGAAEKHNTGYNELKHTLSEKLQAMRLPAREVA